MAILINNVLTDLQFDRVKYNRYTNRLFCATAEKGQEKLGFNVTKYSKFSDFVEAKMKVIGLCSLYSAYFNLMKRKLFLEIP